MSIKRWLPLAGILALTACPGPSGFCQNGSQEITGLATDEDDDPFGECQWRARFQETADSLQVTVEAVPEIEEPQN